MGIWQVTIVGLTMVFLIFAILYLLFILMSYITKLSSREGNPKPSAPQSSRREEEVAAVFAAVYHMMGKAVRIKRIVKGERGWETWKRRGWRGVREWRGNLK